MQIYQRTWHSKSEKYTKQRVKLFLFCLAHSKLFPGIFLLHRSTWGYLTSLESALVTVLLVTADVLSKSCG